MDSLDLDTCYYSDVLCPKCHQELATNGRNYWCTNSHCDAREKMGTLTHDDKGVDMEGLVLPFPDQMD